MVYYRTYRPQKISDLDKADVRERLSSVFSRGEVPHAFLFIGPRGTGKTSAARIVAKLLNCEKLEVGNSNVENEVRKKKSDNRPSNIQPQHQRSNLELPTSYYLVVSRLVPYKKIDLAILAFNRLQLPLVIIGSGHELERLKRMAGPSVKFLSDLTEDRLNWYYRHCRAFILPQEEDFGIAAVEAQMHGKPVIAFHAGGSLDSVKEGETGIFFHQQTENALIDALHRFDKMQFVESACRQNAERFSKERFMEGIRKIISKK